MTRILCIETSSEFCSVSLVEDNRMIGSRKITIEKSHSEHILLLIDTLLKEKKILINQLTAVAVSKGPGSYTGLRIGVSTAKGLCYSLDIPLLSLNSLDLMAIQVKKKHLVNKKVLLCPMLDARRMEVYTKVMDYGLKNIQKTCCKVLDNNSFASLLDNNKVYFFGNGSQKFKKILKSKNALFIDNIFPNASSFTDLVYKKYLNKDFEDLINFEPSYLKDYYFKNK